MTIEAGSHNLSTVSHDLSTASHDISTVSHDISTPSHDISATSHDISTTPYDNGINGEGSQEGEDVTTTQEIVSQCSQHWTFTL